MCIKLSYILIICCDNSLLLLLLYLIKKIEERTEHVADGDNYDREWMHDFIAVDILLLNDLNHTSQAQ